MAPSAGFTRGMLSLRDDMSILSLTTRNDTRVTLHSAEHQKSAIQGTTRRNLDGHIGQVGLFITIGMKLIVTFRTRTDFFESRKCLS